MGSEVRSVAFPALQHAADRSRHVDETEQMAQSKPEIDLAWRAGYCAAERAKNRWPIGLS
jgi:hypothetical protein